MHGDVWSPASTSSCRRLSPMSWPVRFTRATSAPCYVAGWGVRTATSGSTPADICSTRRARIISARPIGRPARCSPSHKQCAAKARQITERSPRDRARACCRCSLITLTLSRARDRRLHRERKGKAYEAVHVEDDVDTRLKGAPCQDLGGKREHEQDR